MDNTPLIKTKRLILRRFTVDDIEALYAIHHDPEVNKYLPWYPLRSLIEANVFLEEHYLSIYQQPRGYQYAICLKDKNIPIGFINISIQEPYDLGYGLNKEYWHHGMISEAAQAIVNQVKKDGLPYITATHDVENSRSGEVMKVVGMNYQYTYEEQWLPKNILVNFRMYQLNFDDKDFVYQYYWDQSNVHFIETNI